MAVRLIDGVSNLDGNADAKQVTITFDEEEASLEIIKDALAQGGYPAAEEEQPPIS